MNEPFNIGDVFLREPRDPDGPPAETFNCRCLKEEFALSELPKELLPQVMNRLTEGQKRFLDGSFRVADTGNDKEKPKRPMAPKGEGTLPRSDFTIEEFLEAIENGLFEKVPISPEFIKDNADVDDHAARVNALASQNISDVLDNKKVNEFLDKVSQVVAKAKIKLPKEIRKLIDRNFVNRREAGEKVFSLGLDENGEIIVQGVMVFPGQGGNILPIIYPDTIAVVHVHFKQLEQPPHGADNNPVVSFGIPSYVINNDGLERWAVGIINGEFRFRSIKLGIEETWEPFP